MFGFIDVWFFVLVEVLEVDDVVLEEVGYCCFFVVCWCVEGCVYLINE